MDKKVAASGVATLRKVASPKQVKRERCLYPGCGRARVTGYGFVYGRGRVPLCMEHLSGRESH